MSLLLNATVPRKGFTLEPDISYGADPRQKLDLYRPDTPRADGKAVIDYALHMTLRRGDAQTLSQVPEAVRAQAQAASERTWAKFGGGRSTTV